MRTLCCFLVALIVTLPAAARAEATPWQEIAPGTKLRLISSDVREKDGSTLVGLEVDLAPDTKTYWRVPGETGIPLRLDFSGSTGISGHQVLWPMPQREVVGGFVDHVYYDTVTIPIRLQTGTDTPSIALGLVMGVCSDICVPVDARLALDPELGDRDAGNHLRLQQALSAVPAPWDGAAGVIGDVRADGETGALTFELDTSRIDAGSMIAATADPGIVFGPPQNGPTNDSITMEWLGWGKPARLVGRDVSLVFEGPGGAFVVTRTVQGVEQRAGSQ